MAEMIAGTRLIEGAFGLLASEAYAPSANDFSVAVRLRRRGRTQTASNPNLN
jgi:hypothetical protein